MIVSLSLTTHRAGCCATGAGAGAESGDAATDAPMRSWRSAIVRLRSRSVRDAPPVEALVIVSRHPWPRRGSPHLTVPVVRGPPPDTADKNGHLHVKKCLAKSDLS